MKHPRYTFCGKSNKFKKQTFLNSNKTFIFQHIFHIHLSISPKYQQACESRMKKMMLVAGCWLHGQVVVLNTFSTKHEHV